MVEKSVQKIAVIGSTGMLGSDIVSEFSLHPFDVLAFTRNDVDITRRGDVFSLLKNANPAIVINCAAYTDVDGSETHRQEALALNADAVRHLAEACGEIGAVLVHYSTDYVFNGSAKEGYKEDDRKHPLNYYGYTKSMGEDYLKEELDSHYLIRTSWLFGRKGRNFVEAIKAKATDREIRVVDDQRGCPTYTRDLARETMSLILERYPYGTYHLTNSGICTWLEFAREIIAVIGSKTQVIPMSSVELTRPAKRPACSVLLNTKFKNILPSWKDAVRRYVGER